MSAPHGSIRAVSRLPAWRRVLTAALLALAAVLLVSPLPDRPAHAQTAQTVEEGWKYIPDGIAAGQSFRLLFVTAGKRDAKSAMIGDYNAFVQKEASKNRALRQFASQFRALVSTATVNARDNTATTGTGVPIYWVNGDKVADNYSDFYDADGWDSVDGKDQKGRSYHGLVITGSNSNGTKRTPVGLGSSLSFGNLNPSETRFRAFALSILSDRQNRGKGHFYALSPVITVDTTRPAKPAGVWAAADDGTLTLNWTDPSDATITGYQYQIKEARSAWHGWKNIPNSDAGTTSYTIDNLDNGTAYTLRIRAVDKGGAGPASKDVRATPGAPASSAPLTASFSGRVRHLSKWRFIVHVSFSDPVTIRGKTGGAKALQVTGGTVTYARRSESADLWTLRVKRSSQVPVTLRLPVTTDCGAPGAVCTADGRKLSAPISLTVPLVPPLRVSNARAKEGEDATVDFRVTMGREAAGPVTVDYETEDGTATAGADYLATSGTLTFAPGETEKTVSVPVLDDAVDEGKETFTLRLRNARSARLFDNKGTGTIVNADPLPRAWLARFGRTVGTHVTDAVGVRLRGAPGQGSQVTVGGYRVPLRQREESGQPSVLEAVAGLLGLGQGEGAGHAFGNTASAAAPDPRLGQGQSVNLDLRQILLGSSFRLALGAADADSSSPRLTAWGRFAGTTFDGQDGDLTLDGDVFTGTVGVDVTWDRLLAGVAVAHSRGDGSFTMPGTEDLGRGDLEQTLTSLHPYLRYAVTDRLDVWGLFGYGWGELDLEMADGVTYETDTTLVMGAFGGRGILLTPAEAGGFQLATRTDAMLTRTSSDAVTGLASSDGDAHRLRLVLEGSRSVAWTDGRSLTPTVELGLRHDWGDAETGFGLEVGGRVQYADPALGLTVEGAARALLAHEDDAYEEWGAWGTVRVAPGADGRGLALTLAPAWGATASGVEGLWTRQTTAGLAPQGPRGPAAGRLTAEVGYGVVGPLGLGMVSPYGGVTLAQGGTQQYRLGGRWVVEDGLTLNLEGAHQQPGGQTPADTGLLLRLELPW